MSYLKNEVLNPERRASIREKAISFRGGAIVNSFVELEGIINKSELARQYFNKSQSWLSQRINGCMQGKHKMEFSAAEGRELVAAFRDVARRLNGLADEIEAVVDVD